MCQDSLDGNSVLIGPESYDYWQSILEGGAAYIFDFNELDWNQTDILYGDQVSNDRFGKSVSLYGDYLLIGANIPFLVTLIDGNWTRVSILDFDGAHNSHLGSISLFGDKAIVGLPSDSAHGLYSGSAFVFEYDQLFVNGFENEVP